MSMPNKKTILDIINHNIALKKTNSQLFLHCEHELKKHKIIFEKDDEIKHKMIFKQCKLCSKYVPCADPEWIKYHGPSGRG